MYTAPISYAQVLSNLRSSGHAIGTVNPTDYHAWKIQLSKDLAVPVTSKSELADFAASRYRYRYNKDLGIRKSSPALALGSLVDCLVLTPDLFDQQYLCEPKRIATNKDGSPNKRGTQDPAQAAEWAEKAAQGITVLDPADLDRARSIAKRALAHIEEEAGLSIGENACTQLAMWAVVTSIGGQPLPQAIVLCGMVDICPTGKDARSLDDLKTTSEDLENTRRLTYHIEDYSYGGQAAMYLDLFNLCTGQQRDTFNFHFVSTGADPILSRSVTMLADTLDVSRRKYLRWVMDFSAAHAYNDWGTPSLPSIIYTPSKAEFNSLS
jgi:hypothetical protein